MLGIRTAKFFQGRRRFGLRSVQLGGDEFSVVAMSLTFNIYLSYCFGVCDVWNFLLVIFIVKIICELKNQFLSCNALVT